MKCYLSVLRKRHDRNAIYFWGSVIFIKSSNYIYATIKNKIQCITRINKKPKPHVVVSKMGDSIKIKL